MPPEITGVSFSLQNNLPTNCWQCTKGNSKALLPPIRLHHQLDLATHRTSPPTWPHHPPYLATHRTSPLTVPHHTRHSPDLTTGLADLNRADFNHWFKSNDFLSKKSCDLNHSYCSLIVSVRAKQTILNTSTCTVWSYSSIYLFYSLIMSLRALDTHSWVAARSKYCPKRVSWLSCFSFSVQQVSKQVSNSQCYLSVSRIVLAFGNWKTSCYKLA